MCGLLTPDSGSGTCLGFDILKESREIKRRVGYMTQRFSFWEDLSIRENLDFVARIYEMRSRREAVERAIEGLNLKARATQLAGSLSGGWKQRLALAACMIFVPCKDGISHNEIEDAKPEHIEAGCNVLLQAMLASANT